MSFFENFPPFISPEWGAEGREGGILQKILRVRYFFCFESDKNSTKICPFSSTGRSGQRRSIPC